MRSDKIPEEVRSLFEYVGQMADTAENTTTRQAFLDVQFVIENDWERLKNANLKFANHNARIVELTDHSLVNKRRLS